ncbi:hypothetical protein [Ensifer adhaerens]|uniref:Uncharacterized protein n=1 Tax=Ensifer adhaerens TaxID=106592 RepID=A0ABY8HRI6_ENSAD|nr:hypothetical protein [Ensifer adhaerens]WFP94708.1 hypothetical protein P4B07_33455 [Ensifer adhaerens]
MPDIIVFHTAWMAKYDGSMRLHIEERMAARLTSVSNLETPE